MYTLKKCLANSTSCFKRSYHLNRNTYHVYVRVFLSHYWNANVSTHFCALTLSVDYLNLRIGQGVLDGKYDDLPEQSFYMVGGIEEVIAKAEKIAKESA